MKKVLSLAAVVAKTAPRDGLGGLANAIAGTQGHRKTVYDPQGAGHLDRPNTTGCRASSATTRAPRWPCAKIGCLKLWDSESTAG